ncbi:GL20855 [Drosophila persimilis]|uniref:GL20855 n=1 Tax=Drosophila persimilis TaxID=7234 RepID=B4H4D2_DROPE|nr:GL20855 [Drosophila persimilis]
MTPSPTKELVSATPTISRRPREEFAEKFPVRNLGNREICKLVLKLLANGE